ncbi:roadblock/LC7 domain-containing protein [Nonomuraea jiangxiensis]|uniref:Predicted regulator of Ras-like GTPase activity, Roadblock/LC7/MglB family n=1 Tax=Nonomuraea jiangxiensis TaxID=633440 RepID=A0A1G8EKE8_9ACTN|nr:roadblock/LC7 domain-containing protein [Nonomuraea jiangxiensis]SDH70316.1 Predicted regulator of Ras-like GTPase activity, Roadblock/LC7/MglB family [Nonomuraea jiangxiensis]
MDAHTTAAAAQGRRRPLSLDVSWVLSPLLALPGVTSGVVLSRDGLILGGSPDVSVETGERTAAMTSSVLGAARALCEGLSNGADGEVVDIVISAGSGYYYIAPAGDRAAIVVAATGAVNVGSLAYEVQHQVQKLIKALNDASAARTPDIPA